MTTQLYVSVLCVTKDTDKISYDFCRLSASGLRFASWKRLLVFIEQGSCYMERFLTCSIPQPKVNWFPIDHHIGRVIIEAKMNAVYERIIAYIISHTHNYAGLDVIRLS